MSYTNELIRASNLRRIGKFFPSRGKYRIIKFLYNYQSSSIQGIDICVPYLPEYNFRFLVNTKDIIGWKIFFFGEYEESTNQLLRKFVRPGDHILEAGANNGSETLLLSRLAGEGKVYAFEPIPHVFNRLKFNVEINGLGKNIVLSQIALGEENKTVYFNIFPLNYANQGMSSKYGNNQMTTKIEVEQVTLDSWVERNNIPKIDFLKMDIQGAEIDLIKGGKNSLQKFKPVVFTEAAESWLDIKVLYRLLKELNYKVYFIGEKKYNLMESESNIRSGNWLAVPEGREITF